MSEKQLQLWEDSSNQKELFDIRITVKWDLVEIARWGMSNSGDADIVVETDTERFEFSFWYATANAGDYKKKAQHAAKLWLQEHKKGNFLGSVKDGEVWFVHPYGWGIYGGWGKPFTTGKATKL